MTLNLRYSTSSIRVDFVWNDICKDVAAVDDITYRLTVRGGSKRNATVFTVPSCITGMSVDVEPGFVYSVLLEALDKKRVLATADASLKSIFNQAEIGHLCRVACGFIAKDLFGGQMDEICIFYRSKPPTYWTKIRVSDGVMRPYIKDPTGHPESAINGQINGLFFSGRVFNGSLPLASPYGSERFKIKCQKLISPHRHNFYFADFYCNNTRHYVTLVVTERGSDVDEYCRRKLTSLDPFDNQFLFLAENNAYGEYRYFINNSIWVEILYTCDVRLWWGEFDFVYPLGESSPEGLPNNKQCTQCNIYRTT